MIIDALAILTDLHFEFRVNVIHDMLPNQIQILKNEIRIDVPDCDNNNKPYDRRKEFTEKA